MNWGLIIKKLLSLSAVAMFLIFTDQALAGQGGGHHGMRGMGHFGHHGGSYNGGYGGKQFAGGYGNGRFRYGGGFPAGYNNGGYGGNGGYGAGYNYVRGYGDVVVVGGGDVPEQIYVYRQVPVVPYSYWHHSNCCSCQQW